MGIDENLDLLCLPGRRQIVKSAVEVLESAHQTSACDCAKNSHVPHFAVFSPKELTVDAHRGYLSLHVASGPEFFLFVHYLSLAWLQDVLVRASRAVTPQPACEIHQQGT